VQQNFGVRSHFHTHCDGNGKLETDGKLWCIMMVVLHNVLDVITKRGAYTDWQIMFFFATTSSHISSVQTCAISCVLLHFHLFSKNCPRKKEYSLIAKLEISKIIKVSHTYGQEGGPLAE
jgi:hypothetical protein